MTPKELTETIVKILDSKKAVDIKAIEVREQTIVADYFVIASGTSSTHTKSLAEDVEYEIRETGVAGRVEGRATGWILLDYGSVLVHVFDKESREYYNLERLWTDANILDISGLLTD
ncbi:MAG: ribosome silencing factor [Clostridiales bacterium]|jgi:ribosome-associated protein|nr:ribosome silencing factor [Clostridiales bacterium]